MRSYALISAATLLLCSALSGQSAIPTSQPSFHLKGTVRDAAGEPVYGVRVAFQNDQATKSVLTNDAGVYEVDLPLGDYTMSAAGMGFTPYRRPSFRVIAPTDLTFDIVMHAYGNCEIPVFKFSGIVTAEEWATAQKPSCLLEDFFPVPSRDAPFNVSFRYRSRTADGNTISYAGPVFVAYNLLSLRADRATYDSKKKSLQASGHVVAVNEPDTVQRADSIAFTLADGRAIPATQPQTFHVKGTISFDGGAVLGEAQVVFHSIGFDRTVTTNQVGVYETDLPLGIYRVSADYKQGLRTYTRHLLRAASPTTITLNVTLYLLGGGSCDFEMGAGATPEQREEATKDLCGGEDFFADSSNGDDFHQIHIRYYSGRKATGDGYLYGADSHASVETPVFVEYNLFSLQADRVIYDADARTIKASGDVVVIDESGAAQHADSLTFKMDNGKATPLP